MLPDFLIGPKTAVRESIGGRASGIFNMGAFAFYWAVLGASALPAPLVPPCLLIAFVGSGLAFAGASRLRLQAQRLPSGTWSLDQVRRLRRAFLLISAGQALGVGIAVVFCGVAAKHWEWLGPAIAFPVGLHFFALARLFRVPVYSLTGVALCTVGLVTVLVVPAHAGISGQLPFLAGAPAPLWRLVPGFGAALVLWATCAIMFLGGREIVGLAGLRPTIS